VGLSHGCVSYGVGAGDSPGEGEGASTEPSVFGGFRLAALCRVRDGIGDGLVTAGVVVVAVVPCCCVQEATNVIPITALIKHNRYLFIGCEFQFESRRMFGCLKSSQHASNEALWKRDIGTIGVSTVFTATIARAIYLHDAPLDPWRTAEGLCRDASEEILCRVESAHR